MRSTAVRRRGALTGTLFGTLLFTSALSAQEVTVQGTVLGPDDAPLAGQTVVLHRVDDGGGATIAETLTSDEGAYRLRAPAGPDTSAVYFVAARYRGELYIGAPFRAPGDGGEQVIQVGVPSQSASALLGDAQTRVNGSGSPAISRNWLLLLIPLIGVAAAAAYAFVPRSRVPARRALLIRVAELDERLDGASGGGPDAERRPLVAERERLVSRLRAG